MNLNALTNERTGIVNRLNLIKNDNGAPRIYSYGAEMADLKKLGNIYHQNKFAGGAGFTREQGQKAAIGELIERYCCSMYDEKEIMYGTYEDLTKSHNVVDPKLFSLFSNNQYSQENFPFKKFDRDTFLAWCSGRSVLTGEEILLPASLCYLPYIHKRRDEAVISPSTSTGAAASDTLQNAVVGGMYECIERDAFTIQWLNQMPVRKILFDSSSGDFLNSQYRKYFKSDGYKYYVYDITTDLDVPTFYTIAEITIEDKKIITVGAATNLNPAYAVLKSMKEAVQGKTYVISEINKDPKWQPTYNFSNVNDFSVSAKLYTVYPQLRRYLLSIEDRIIEEIPAGKISNMEIKDEYDKLLDIFREKNIKVFFVDMTTIDCRLCGIYVSKVIIPQLQPLHGDHNYPFLGGNRLYEVPCTLGYFSEPRIEQYFKSVRPHPFP